MVLFTIIDFHDGTGHRRKVLFSFVLIVNQNTGLDYFVVLFLLGHPVICSGYMFCHVFYSSFSYFLCVVFCSHCGLMYIDHN